MAPKWAPGGPKIAPWRPPGGLWRPWGGWGGPSRIFDGFGAHLGVHLGLRNHPKMCRNLSPNRASLFIIIFGPLEASGATFGIHVGVILECFLGSQAWKQDFSKTFKNRWKTMIFEVPGGRKSIKNWSGNGIQQKPGCRSVLGGSWDRFWSDLGIILGPKIGPERGPKTNLILERFLRGSWGGQVPAAGFRWGSAGLGPDRRGGVGVGEG